MASNGTAVWRVRPSGNNNNGGGYDCSISAAATGTNGSLSGVTFTDATASAFTSGMAGRSINIVSVGQYLIASFISATQITLAVGSGGTLPQLSGGAKWTVGAGTDYSQQNAAQLTQSGGTVSTATTTLTDTGASFTSALIGNAIRVAGSGISTIFTFIPAVPTSTTLTLQTSPGTTGTSVTYNIGGGWANFVTNTTSAGPLVNPNWVYILGAGIPNPASYTPDYTVSATWTPLASDNFGSGYVTFANDPGTPGYKPWPDTTGGMPLIRDTFHGTVISMTGQGFYGLWCYVEASVAAGDALFLSAGGGQAVFAGCIFDQNGIDAIMVADGQFRLFGCEVFSSSGGSGGSNIAVRLPYLVDSCNIHNTVGIGIRTTTESALIINTIVAKCSSIGIDQVGGQDNQIVFIHNCTIDGNVDSGIRIFNGNAVLAVLIITNNIISNHATNYGIAISAGTAAQIAATRTLIDYNTFYNNTTDMQNASYGPHDTHGGSNPYVGQATQNYTLA